MQLISLSLQNFTNYQTLKLDCSEFLNLLIGDNAQGKSNLLDAIYYLSCGSSNRYASDFDLVKWGNAFFHIKAEFKNKFDSYQIKISFKQDGKKAIAVNGNKITKVTDLISLFNVVFFSPDDLFIVKGNPALRRKYLDNEITQVSPAYYNYLQQYKRILHQRNSLLKEIKLKKQDSASLEVWDLQLAKAGSGVIKKRQEMLRKLKPLARLAHRRLTNGLEELEIIYKNTVLPDTIPETNLDVYEKAFLDRLLSSREEDLQKGFTGLGPHRDDFDIKINDTEAKTFGSQGQQRTASLSLKLAELEFMHAETGEYPVLLLDDVLSELDKNRREQLLTMVSEKIQTFITCTETDYIDSAIIAKANIYEVIKGSLTKRASRK